MLAMTAAAALVLVAALLVAGPPSAAAAPPAQDVEATTGAVQAASQGGTWLELASGRRVELALPAGAWLAAAGTVGESGDGWIAAAVAPAGRGTEIVLLAGRAGRGADPDAAHGTDGAAGRAADAAEPAASLPPPPGRSAALRLEPLPLIEAGRLAGLVWLDGADRRSLAVRYAPWSGMGWGEPRLISPPGPGSQLALSAARLDDGSWLLAWSAFDGHDDEIVWSLGREGSWSAPRRVAADNDVPDITPAVVAADGGALLAWSRLDAAAGAYRVVTARFRNGRWGEPQVVGPAGSVFPSFEPASPGLLPVVSSNHSVVRLDAQAPRPGPARLLYVTSRPNGWEVLELDAAGRPSRVATFVAGGESGEAGRPVLAPGRDPSAALRYPLTGGERAASWRPAPATSGDRREARPQP
ncbi:MAG TPA: hypothetical protein VHQ90_09055 [Thermoanaerobaculia bacterium]|nr:hypothetical protein [Thermoanaerobaculia bacterium]